MSQTRHKKKRRGDLFDVEATFKNLREMSNREIVITDRLLLFCCADAVIRIGGIRNLDQLPTFRHLYDEAIGIVGRLGREIKFPRLAQAGYALDHVRALASLCLERDAYNRVIKWRLLKTPFGAKYLRGEIDPNTEQGLEDALRFIYDSKPKRKILEGIKPPIRKELGEGDHLTSSDQNEALLLLYERLGELEAEPGDVRIPEPPANALIKKIPFEPWDNAFEEILTEEIKIYAWGLAPILDGKLDNLHLDVFNRLVELRRQESGGETTRPKQYNRIKKRFERPRFLRFLSLQDEIRADRPAPGNPEEDAQIRIDADSIRRVAREALKADGVRKPDKILHALELLEEGRSYDEASREAGISRDTLLEFRKKLKSKFE